MSKMTAGIASQNHFAMNPVQPVPRSQFPLRWGVTTTLDAGFLYPVLTLECLPGETYSATIQTFLRFLSLKNPIMSDLFLDWFAFFTPNRLVWDHWVTMQGEVRDPGDSTDFVVPVITGAEHIVTITPLSIGDYFGLPVNVPIDTSVFPVSALPFRAYNLIWNEWFRDQNYQNSVPTPFDDGPDTLADNYGLLRRAKKHDYFSSALPSPQKGPAVLIPWDNGGLAPVIGDGSPINFADSSSPANAGYNLFQPGGVGPYPALWNNPATDHYASLTTPENLPGYNSHMYANVAAVSASLNALRQSIAIQQVYELDARGGTRYTERLRSTFAVNPEDYRLQRPEYIGGGSHMLSISSVPQTSPSTEDSPQARLAAYGTGGFRGGIHYSTKEHGYIHFLINVRAPIIYQQRIHRMWTRSTRFDFPEPLLAHIGEQAVMAYEMFFPPTTPETVWGYQERFGEYRFGSNTVTGLMRGQGAVGSSSLDAWNLALDYFSTPPVYDSNWIQDDPPVDRVIAVPSQPAFLLDFLLEGVKTSPLPVYGVPGLTRF